MAGWIGSLIDGRGCSEHERQGGRVDGLDDAYCIVMV